jgi:hypothetical protein
MYVLFGRFEASYEFWISCLLCCDIPEDLKSNIPIEDLSLQSKFGVQVSSMVVPVLPPVLSLDILFVLVRILQSLKVFPSCKLVINYD